MTEMEFLEVYTWRVLLPTSIPGPQRAGAEQLRQGQEGSPSNGVVSARLLSAGSLVDAARRECVVQGRLRRMYAFLKFPRKPGDMGKIQNFLMCPGNL